MSFIIYTKYMMNFKNIILTTQICDIFLVRGSTFLYILTHCYTFPRTQALSIFMLVLFVTSYTFVPTLIRKKPTIIILTLLQLVKMIDTL